MEDLAVNSPIGIRIFKGTGGINATLEENFNLLGYVFKRIYLAQLNKHIGPLAVINNETNDRDEIVAQNGNNILIFNNNNNNTTPSTPETTISFSDFLSDFKVADVNNDGYNDIIAITQYEIDFNAYGGVFIFLNNNGTINNSPIYSNDGISYVNSLEIADFNKDGWNDLVIDIGLDTIALFLNNKSSSLFSNSPSESFRFEEGPFFIPPIFARKIVATDLYNKGGLGVIMSGWPGVTPGIEYETMIRINASTSDANPAPAYLFNRDVQVVDSLYHPKLMLFNRGDRDFLKYRIYKKNYSNYVYFLFDSTSSNQYIDTTEDLIYTLAEPVDPPEINLNYYAVAVDNSYKVSINSDTIGYVAFAPFCPDCPGGPDNFQVTNEENIMPKEYSLSNYPNPFNPTTKINYELRVTNYVSLKVYDILGNEIAKLVNEKQNAGRYSIIFDGSNLSSGIYFYRWESNGIVLTRRMLLIK